MTSSVVHLKFLSVALQLLTVSVVEAALNLTLEYQLREDQTPGTVIGDVKTDSGLATEYPPEVVGRMRFRFLSASEQLRVGERTGVVVLSSAIDRAVLCPYAEVCRLTVDVVVRPSDVFQIVRVSVVVISVNRNSPRFPVASVEFDVAVNVPPGTVWALPAADDPDGGDEGVQTYRIAPPSTSTFALDVVILPDQSRDVHLRLLTTLNRSVSDSYSLTVLAEDGGAPARTGSLAVNIRVSDVIDDGPRFDHVTYDVTVDENMPPMSVVTSVRATSGRRDALIRYSFDDNTRRRYGQMFAMSNATGDVYIVGVVDRERVAECLLTLIAVDAARPASLPAYSHMRVRVGDVNDNPPRLTLTVLSPPGGGRGEVRDGAAPGAFIAHVTVTDPDTGNASVVRCDVNTTNFRLVPLGTDFQLTTSVMFGRGHDPVYVINITCSDRGLPPLSSFRLLDVIVVDSGPLFPAEVVSARVSVDVAPGTPVVRLNATGSDVGPEAEIVYSMSQVSGRVEALTIDSATGWVRTRVNVTRDSVNATLVYLVTARDLGNPPLSATATLQLLIVDTGNDVMTDSTLQIAPSSSSSTPASTLVLVTSSSGDYKDDMRSDVIIASVVCATVVVLALILVAAVLFCFRRRSCVSKVDQVESAGIHSFSVEESMTAAGGRTVPSGASARQRRHSNTRPHVVVARQHDDVSKYCNNYNHSSSSNRDSISSVQAASSEHESFSSTAPLRPGVSKSEERRRSDAGRAAPAVTSDSPFVFTLIPPSPHGPQHVVGADGGRQSTIKTPVVDHESDSGLSGSLTDSGRALADEPDAAGTTALCAVGCSSPLSLTGSYCPARAVDARRARLAQRSRQFTRTDQRAGRRGDGSTVELPSYDTFV